MKEKMNFKNRANSYLTDILVIVIFWGISLFITYPVGNFPLNDDWSFAIAVERLLQNGDFRPTGWTSMPLLTQVLWGALFCLPAGFSFNALRLSTLTLSIGGVIGLYCLLRLIKMPRWLAVASGLTLAFNPVYHVLSNTFMTDVPFTAMLVWAFYFFVRNLQNNSDRDLFFATSIATGAVLCRQVGVIAPLSFLISSLILRGFTIKSLPRAIIPTAVTTVTLLLFQFWLKTTGRLPYLYYEKTSKLYDIFSYPMFAAANFLRNSWIVLLYLGWFLLPILILCCVVGKKAPLSRKNILASGAAVVFIGYSLFRLLELGRLMPLHKGIIVKEGIGPMSLYDTMLLHLPNVPPLSNSFWFVITIMSVAGGALLVKAVSQLIMNLLADLRVKNITGDKAVSIYFLVFAIVYLFPFLTTEISDRYLMPVMPALIVCLGILRHYTEKLTAMMRPVLAGALLVFLALFSTAGTRDYFDWNRARWSLIGDLSRSGQVSPKEMDGGFEFNGLYLYDSSYVMKPGKSWWWVNDNRFIIAFGNIPGWMPIAEKSYSRWMPPFKGNILLLERKTME